MSEQEKPVDHVVDVRLVVRFTHTKDKVARMQLENRMIGGLASPEGRLAIVTSEGVAEVTGAQIQKADYK